MEKVEVEETQKSVGRKKRLRTATHRLLSRIWTLLVICYSMSQYLVSHNTQVDVTGSHI